MASNYTAPPPSYPGPQNKLSSVPPDQEASQPLLGDTAGASSSTNAFARGLGAYYDQPEEGDVPDDFKVSP